jgi:carboxyl-terminal processing protease
VLIGRHTAGAGQIVAITLKGRKNTKFFGEPTAGGLTITKQIHVASNLIMHLSEGLYQDRIGRPYPINIEPDKALAFESVDPTAPIDSDNGITEAMQWLNDSNLTAMRK